MSDSCDLMDCSPPGSSVHGILQARVLQWVPMPSSRDLPNPGIEPTSLVSLNWQADSLPLSHLGSPALGNGSFFSAGRCHSFYFTPSSLGFGEWGSYHVTAKPGFSSVTVTPTASAKLPLGSQAPTFNPQQTALRPVSSYPLLCTPLAAWQCVGRLLAGSPSSSPRSCHYNNRIFSRGEE